LVVALRQSQHVSSTLLLWWIKPEQMVRAFFRPMQDPGRPRLPPGYAAHAKILTAHPEFLYNSGFSAFCPREETRESLHRASKRTQPSRKKIQGTEHLIFGSIMKTFSAKAHEVTREWYVIDATDKVLGRVASEVARRLRGKHKPEFTPHVDTGDFIIVINASKLKVTGNKTLDKKYYRHSGYPGGIYETTFGKMQERFPGRALEKAVKGMLPKGPLGYAMIKKLKVYAEATHPHSAQQPKALEI
jgi:large subunit ribosomal protein L13